MPNCITITYFRKNIFKIAAESQRTMKSFYVSKDDVIIWKIIPIKKGKFIRTEKIKNPIETGYGMLAGGPSLTKALLRERKKDREIEERKYRLHSKK